MRSFCIWITTAPSTPCKQKFNKMMHPCQADRYQLHSLIWAHLCVLNYYQVLLCELVRQTRVEAGGCVTRKLKYHSIASWEKQTANYQYFNWPHLPVDISHRWFLLVIHAKHRHNAWRQWRYMFFFRQSITRFNCWANTTKLREPCAT